MGNINPSILINIIDKEILDFLDRVVYDGTRRFIGLCETRHLSIATSSNYQLIYRSLLASGTYFSFMGQQGIIFVDCLSLLPHDLLIVAEDEELMKLITEIKRGGFHALVPTTWPEARQMNHGLYEGAAQFDIKPPLLRIGTSCTPERFSEVVEYLAGINNKLEELWMKRVRES